VMAESSGAYPFMFFSAMMVLQFFVVLFVFPETKGVSLEEMQRKLGIACLRSVESSVPLTTSHWVYYVWSGGSRRHKVCMRGGNRPTGPARPP